MGEREGERRGEGVVVESGWREMMRENVDEVATTGKGRSEGLSNREEASKSAWSERATGPAATRQRGSCGQDPGCTAVALARNW
jgi:hypothetical protein